VASSANSAKKKIKADKDYPAYLIITLDFNHWIHVNAIKNKALPILLVVATAWMMDLFAKKQKNLEKDLN
jgi:hypothetical protein